MNYKFYKSFKEIECKKVWRLSLVHSLEEENPKPSIRANSSSDFVSFASPVKQKRNNYEEMNNNINNEIILDDIE